MADNTSGPTADEIAVAITRQLTTQGQTSDQEGGSEPLVLVADGENVQGSFTFGIAYNGVTYTLTVSIPPAGSTTDPYVFSLVESGASIEPGTGDIATFKYLSSTEWCVVANLPTPLVMGDFSIQTLSVNISKGTTITCAT